MPLYELECRNCEHRWDVRIAWKAALPPCPECGSEQVRKVLHTPALVFKGSGWHVTDYASNGAGNGISSSSISDHEPKSTEKTEKAEKTESKGSSTET